MKNFYDCSRNFENFTGTLKEFLFRMGGDTENVLENIERKFYNDFGNEYFEAILNNW